MAITSDESVSHFAESPAALTEARFVDRFGAVYEHSPWVAQRLWQRGIDARHDAVTTLAQAMADILADATREEQLRLIKAHPDLAGRAALQGELTHDSTDEQASAGLDQCTAEEFERFQRLNDAYQTKFDMPFIMAVRGSDRHQILAAFEERLPNDEATEFARALTEINRIAALRLQSLVHAGKTSE